MWIAMSIFKELVLKGVLPLTAYLTSIIIVLVANECCRSLVIACACYFNYFMRLVT